MHVSKQILDFAIIISYDNDNNDDNDDNDDNNVDNDNDDNHDNSQCRLPVELPVLQNLVCSTSKVQGSFSY